MVDYLYPSRVALDPATGNLVVNGSLTVHAPSDTSGTSPLPITDPSGLPLSLVTTTRQGLTEPFIVQDHDTVVLRSGSYAVVIESLDGIRDAAEAAATSAAASAQAAFEAQLAAEAATGGAGTTVHGQLANLGSDDHPQYHNDARGDLRYYTKEQTGSLVANAVSAASTGDRARGNHTGTQAISTVENLETRLALLESGGGGGSGILVLTEGQDIPLGTPPGLIAWIPIDEVPVTQVETISYDSEGASVTCAVPSGVEVGDAVVFIAAFDPPGTAGDLSVSDSGWTEIIDYSAQHSRDSAAFVYRVTDSAALAALGTAVTANYGQTARRMGVCFVIPGSRVASAWPAYTSGSNRSAATLNSTSVTGATIQGFSTTTAPFHKVVAFVVHDAAADPAASTGFTQVGFATGSAGGAAPRTLTVLVKDLATGPIPAAVVTHSTASSASHGGGQFIVPVA